jgi:hypothetical protein
MPFTIFKQGDKYKLRNQTTGKVMKKTFLTRESAKKSSESYMKNKSKAKKNKY